MSIAKLRNRTSDILKRTHIDLAFSIHEGTDPLRRFPVKYLQ